MKALIGSVDLNRASCIEDFISVLLANAYAVTLEYKANNIINVKIEKEINE